jgi:hypothetical protein
VQPIDLMNPLAHVEDQKVHVDELIKLSLSNPIILLQLDRYRSNEQTLRQIYSKLTLVAGVSFHGFYIPAASIVDPCSLMFLLEHFDGKQFSIKNYDAHNSSLYVADKLLSFFRKPNPHHFMVDDGKLGTSEG